MELITRTINSRPTFVRPHATVLQACEAAGVEVPRFCYHNKLSVAGNCRRCLVEVYKSPKPVVSCARPVSKGRIVYTNTPLVRKAREAVLEFLLLNHPLDCPICDQGGECDLQEQALSFGSDRSRFFDHKRSVEDKECGPIVKTIRTRCIHCTRCVRFSSEVSGQESLGSFGRGEDTEIGTYIQFFLRTELSGNLVDLCPVGALTSKPYAYTARSWELQSTDTLDFFDAACSDITVYTRKRTAPQISGLSVKLFSQEEILRILPRTNGLYSENWISDRTRYAFDGLKHNRGIHPASRSQQNRWRNHNIEDLFQQFFSVFASSKLPAKYKHTKFHFCVGPHANLERMFSLFSFSKRSGYDRKNSRILQDSFPRILNFDLPFMYSLNRALSTFSDGSLGGVLFVGVNPRYESSLLNTAIRREQARRALPVASLSVFSSLRYSNSLTNHVGNSFFSIQSIIENRNAIVTSSRISLSRYSLLQGAEIYRIKEASFFNQLSLYLGKRLFSKSSSYANYGTIHSSVSSRAFAFLGIVNCPLNFNKSLPQLNQKTIENANKISSPSNIFFSVNSPSIFKKKFLTQFLPKNNLSLSFSTHGVQSSSTANYLLPMTSLYERSGHFRILEGRIRKHNKVVTKPKLCFNFESLLSAFCRSQNLSFWRRWSENIAFFFDECPRGILTEQSTSFFNIRPFTRQNTNKRIGMSSSFYTTVRDFYLNDSISQYSPTRGECSLFLGTTENFYYER